MHSAVSERSCTPVQECMSGLKLHLAGDAAEFSAHWLYSAAAQERKAAEGRKTCQ